MEASLASLLAGHVTVRGPSCFLQQPRFVAGMELLLSGQVTGEVWNVAIRAEDQAVLLKQRVIHSTFTQQRSI